MNKKRFLEMSKDLENKIVELAHTMGKLGIDNVMFDQYDERKKDFNKVYINEYRHGWEIVYSSEGYRPISKSQRDMYKLKIDEKELEYDYSEED